jgi:hypothetical protein
MNMVTVEALKHGFFCSVCGQLTEHVKVANEWVCVDHVDVKEKKRAYYQRPDVKEKKRAYRQRPDVKEKKRAYRQRPDVKEKKREANRRYLQRRQEKLRRILEDSQMDSNFTVDAEGVIHYKEKAKP